VGGGEISWRPTPPPPTGSIRTKESRVQWRTHRPHLDRCVALAHHHHPPSHPVGSLGTLASLPKGEAGRKGRVVEPQDQHL
jgi:hypothetical protein